MAGGQQQGRLCLSVCVTVAVAVAVVVVVAVDAVDEGIDLRCRRLRLLLLPDKSWLLLPQLVLDFLSFSVLTLHCHASPASLFPLVQSHS